MKDKIFAAFDKFASFIFSIDEEGGNAVSKFFWMVKEVINALGLDF